MPNVWTPEHSQDDIQNFIIELWLGLCKSDIDLKRAEYMRDYSGTEGGWCDGWSYALSRPGGEKLAEIWREIDQACTDRSNVSSTTMFEAVERARVAALYHVMNSEPPADAAQRAAYDAAGFDMEKTPNTWESWKHTFGSPLELYVIQVEIKKLQVGTTLRLTSSSHDAAVKRTKDGFVVAETERHGIQLCTKLQDAMAILEDWQEQCAQDEEKEFFSQTMVV